MTLLHIRAAPAAIDIKNNRILWASKDAWRYLGWRYLDAETGKVKMLPAEHFGPLPTTPVGTRQ